MHDPEVLILDEPTSGLDPLMRQVFIDLILEEKQRGKTILMSSHIFTEIERTCDRVAIIKDGRLVTVENIHDLQSMRRQVIDVTVSSQEEIESLTKCNLQFEAVKAERHLSLYKETIKLFYKHFQTTM